MSSATRSYSEPLIQNNTQMNYRPLGKTGLMVSALSFGCMRLSEDQTLNTRVISSAIDCGINYFETTRGYCGGQCQQRTAPGLVDKTVGVIVSGKAGIDQNTTEYSFFKEIERQLDILGLSHFKFFQVGWFSWGRMPDLLKRSGVLRAIRKAQDIGLVQYMGFTGHDSPENFTACIETGLFDTCTVPYNMINRMYEPTIKRAGELGVGVVAMCPVAGGVLSFESTVLKKALGADLPTTEIALQFVLANPNVSTACSGMNTMEQLEQNVVSVKKFDAEKVMSFDKMCAALDAVRERLGTKVCTGCRYCMPCPQKVDIPRFMDIHRISKGFGLTEWGAKEMAGTAAETHAKNCDECGACEKKCPNGIFIREKLKEVQKLVDRFAGVQ